MNHSLGWLQRTRARLFSARVPEGASNLSYPDDSVFPGGFGLWIGLAAEMRVCTADRRGPATAISGALS